MATTPDPGADRPVELLGSVPGGTGLLAKAALTSVGRRGAGAGLPDRVLMVKDQRQDVDRLADYARVCGFTLRDTVPPTWLHVLTFGLQMDLLTRRDFPFAAMGMVHVANEMTLHRPVGVDEDLTLTVHAADLRPHRSGVAFDVVEQVRVGADPVWDGRSEYLIRGARLEDGAGAPGEGAAATERAATDPGARIQPSSTWRLPADLGRRYARAAGDYNPIHLHPWSAKALGFPRAIVHGMWTHARALAALQSRLPASYTTAVQFRKPVLLPSTVGFGVRRDDAGEGWDFAVTSRDGAKDHLLGTVR
ncbi:MaoC family dehydratase [Ornithinicoccus hortensis]|uniref:Acyl dehydratase n=1 Tax=Ornithinicoccus hortensis TaxID=82346 RepID=A0A542YPK3_9MICO|nr:MaoC/PaaZ C-terminal domain-containing protein [Ornithinicoccus hortensis]TQL49977.1 acyl dehydratase [Ornithinicoccus hortensis]